MSRLSETKEALMEAKGDFWIDEGDAVLEQMALSLAVIADALKEREDDLK